MEWWVAIVVAAGGLVAGFTNTLAGGGSLISLPILILVAGLPEATANGTNRVAILIQNVSGTAGYHRQGIGDLRAALLLAMPACCGAYLGASLAADIDRILFRRVLGVVMLSMLAVMLARPGRWLEGGGGGRSESGPPGGRAGSPGLAAPWQALLFFGLGVYGGFLQAGIGVFLLAALVLGCGFDLLHANAVKVTVILVYTAVALAVFASAKQVDWTVGLVLAAGTATGAWLATLLAVRKGNRWLLGFVVLVVGASALRFLLA